jgi:hypothetical protein
MLLAEQFAGTLKVAQTMAKLGQPFEVGLAWRRGRGRLASGHRGVAACFYIRT